MGTIKASKSLFNRNNKVTKYYDEPIVEKNLYTILGFNVREDFENKTSKFVDKKFWQSFVDCFAREIDYVATEQVIKTLFITLSRVLVVTLSPKLSAQYKMKSRVIKKERKQLEKPLVF